MNRKTKRYLIIILVFITIIFSLFVFYEKIHEKDVKAGLDGLYGSEPAIYNYNDTDDAATKLKSLGYIN